MASNYKVCVSLCFIASGQSGGVMARFSSQGNEIFNFRGYILSTLARRAAGRLTKNSVSVGTTVLAHGTIAAPAIGKWTSLAIGVHETTITAWVNGQQVAVVTDNDPNYATGIPGIETDAFRGTWSSTQFKGFSVTSD